MSRSRNEILRPEPDGLVAQDVGIWAEDKYALVALYATLFSSGMKNKWGNRVYIDLYAAAGVSKIRGTERLVYGSPLLALTVKDPFDKYIFCEEDPEQFEALKIRAKRLRPDAKVQFILGDCDEKIDSIVSEVPKGSLTFCFVDPYDLGIRFSTIEKLAALRTDFLVLLALQMDAARNKFNYFAEGSTKVADMLGDPNWREHWRRAEGSGESFPLFLADQFKKKLSLLGYRPPPPMRDIRDGNRVLYRLGIFSRSEKAYDFWDEVLNYSTPQRKLF